MTRHWLLDATISYDIATFFLPVSTISKSAHSPWGPCAKKFLEIFQTIDSSKNWNKSVGQECFEIC